MQWWLLEEEIRFRTNRVQQALARLVQQDLVTAIRQSDGRIRYRLKRNKNGEQNS